MVDAPKTAGEVTTAWLSDVLGVPVVDFELEPTGAAGFVSDTYRTVLSYGAGPTAGREILFKHFHSSRMSSTVPNRRAASQGVWFFHSGNCRAKVLWRSRTETVSGGGIGGI